jgi:hypothetical protein
MDQVSTSKLCPFAALNKTSGTIYFEHENYLEMSLAALWYRRRQSARRRTEELKTIVDILPAPAHRVDRCKEVKFTVNESGSGMHGKYLHKEHLSGLHCPSA